jgi:hypothetical protein
MSSSTLYRWSGLVLISGGVLGVVGALLVTLLFPGHHHTPQEVVSASWPWAQGALLVGYVLSTIGVPGLYLRQAARAGGLGFVGFGLLLVGLLLGGVSLAAITTFMLPILGQWSPTFLSGSNTIPLNVLLLLIIGPFLLQGVGGILLGIASLRARVFPRWAGILLLAWGILYIIVAPLPPSSTLGIVELAADVIFFLALAWFGYALVAPRQEQVGAPSAASPASQLR